MIVHTLIEEKRWRLSLQIALKVIDKHRFIYLTGSYDRIPFFRNSSLFDCFRSNSSKIVVTI